jgi:ketosteroid isomerase-like protein
MRKLIVVFAVGILTAGWAAASDKTDIMAVIKQWAGADEKAAEAACTDDASVIDDVPPYEWHGPGACGKWLDSYHSFAKAKEMTDAVTTVGAPRHFEIEGDRAYVVFPATFTSKMQDKPNNETARVAMTLLRTSAGWRITGWSWAD